MNLTLENKTVLFIAPEFYGYEKTIASKMRELGASVIYYPERENSIKYKYVNNFKNANLIKYQEDYYLHLYEKIKKIKIDYLFVIRGFLMPVRFVEKIRSLSSNTKLIMHQWDSMRNNKYEKCIDVFDKVFSFDIEDCQKNSKLTYLPNFYLPAYLKKNNSKIKYDICFIGWAYDDRLKILKEISSRLKEKKIFQYSYIPPSRYLLNILKRAPLKPTKLKSISLSKVCEIIQQSFSVLDITDINQTGYTFRTIDAMAAGRKLITTNPFVQYEKFYDKQNILIIDRNNPTINSEFFETPFVHINIQEYSLDNWIKKIFDDCT